MHYMRITDNDEDFSRLAERLVENGFSASSELGSGNYILCRFSGKNDASLLKIISDYIWDVKFLHYVIMRSKQREEQYLRALDIIIDTMNVANSFKDEDDVIIERLREYFREYKDINIDGFCEFQT